MSYDSPEVNIALCLAWDLRLNRHDELDIYLNTFNSRPTYDKNRQTLINLIKNISVHTAHELSLNIKLIILYKREFVAENNQLYILNIELVHTQTCYV